jgi:hypothetical protein
MQRFTEVFWEEKASASIYVGSCRPRLVFDAVDEVGLFREPCS